MKALEMPSLAALQVVEVLSRHTTMRAAGEELGVTHAAVSTTLSRLETRLGVQLFERGAGAPRPTDACRGLLEAYGVATTALSRALREASAERRPKLTISLPRSVAQVWLSAKLHLLYAELPRLGLYTHSDAKTPDFGAVDAALVEGGLAPPAACDGIALYDECVTVVCAPAYACAQRITTPASVARSTLFIHDRGEWRRWFDDAGLVSDPDLKGVELADRDLALQLSLAGQGVSLACAVVTHSLIEQGMLVAPVPISVSTGRRIWLVWPRGRRPSDDLLRFHDWLICQLPQTAGDSLSERPARRAVSLGVHRRVG